MKSTYRVIACAPSIAISEATLTFAAVDQPERAVSFWNATVAKEPDYDPTVETLALIMSTARFQPFAWHRLSTGSLTETSASMRDIFKIACAQSAWGITLLHNHPSGDPRPSEADIAFTRRLNEACGIMDIRFIDHVIVAGSHFVAPAQPHFSFRENGLL